MSQTPPVAPAPGTCCGPDATGRGGAADGAADRRGEGGADRAAIRRIPGGGTTIGTDAPAFRADGEGPARHVTLRPFRTDAAAFAAWAGGRLPTEAEREHAAKGGDDRARYPRGEAGPDGSGGPRNIWQGDVPHRNAGADGRIGTAPVDACAPNGFGLFDACGNVREWCADAVRLRSLRAGAKTRNAAATAERERVMKGGSHLCHRSYCWRDRIAARSGRSPDASAGHVGFRVAYDG